MVAMNSVLNQHNGLIPMLMDMVTRLMASRAISAQMFTVSPSTTDSAVLIPTVTVGRTLMQTGRLTMEQMRTSTIH